MTRANSAMRRLENQLYGRLLHAKARSAALSPLRPWDLTAFQGHKYCLVVSFRRNGDPVVTPVWFGVARGRLYLRTDAGAGKIKRIRRTPRVRIAPCTARGRPLAPLIEGVAEILEGAEVAAAEQALRDNYGLGRRVYERALASGDAAYVEVGPQDEREDGPAPPGAEGALQVPPTPSQMSRGTSSTA
jgi:PPOX class probable F420-dependent enzyme